jgi:hypothetical protein
MIQRSVRSGGDGPEVQIGHSSDDVISMDMGSNARQIVGKGPLVSETRNVGDFGGISVGSAVHLRYSTSSATKVEVSAQSNVLPNVVTKIQSGILRIEMADGSYRNIEPVTVTVSSPHLESLEVSGAAEATAKGIDEASLRLRLSGSGKAIVDGSSRSLIADISGAAELSGKLSATESFEADLSGSSRAHLEGPFGDVHLTCSGASETTLRHLRATKVRLDLSSSSTGTFDGTTDALELQCDGGSSADLKDLAVQNAQVSVSGAGHVVVDVRKSLSAEASGAGSVEYRGTPQVHPVTSGAGRIEPISR